VSWHLQVLGDFVCCDYTSIKQLGFFFSQFSLKTNLFLVLASSICWNGSNPIDNYYAKLGRGGSHLEIKIGFHFQFSL
jgi:hypothetical protein